MSDAAIRIEALAKRYTIGALRPGYSTLRDSLAQSVHKLQHLLTRRSDDAANSIWALRKIDLEVNHGEVLGILGRNGAGKSTLLKILSRITSPTRGRIVMRGRIGSLLEVGTGFHPELTGRENIFMNGAIIGMTRSEIRAKFDAIVEFSGVEAFLDTPVKRYSSGMYTRLAFAVAAHLDPEILVIDEVLAVGDPAFQNKCLGKMGEIAQAGRTVLFVSHNVGMMQVLCQRGIVLSEGVVACDDSMDRAAAFYLAQLEAKANVDIAQRTDRSGAGAVRICKVEITAGGGAQPGMLASGRPARFRFVINGDCVQPSFGFTIYDHLGGPVTHLNSRLRSDEDLENGSREFICDIDELTLLPGRYRIALALHANGELQDHLSAATYFDVDPGAIRGRPAPMQSSYGRVLLPHRWTLPSAN
jgi:lipopolysaccharide transport system ATP-binding protein